MDTAVISWLELPLITFQSSTEAQIVYTALWMMNYFPPYTVFFFHSRSNASLSLLCLLYPCKISRRATFLPAKTDHAAYMEANHPYYIRMPLVICKLHSDNLLPITFALWDEYQEEAPPNARNLTFSS